MIAGEGLVKAAAIAHPAVLKVPEEIEKIQVPTLWLCAETDPTFGEAAREGAKEVLEVFLIACRITIRNEG